MFNPRSDRLNYGNILMPPDGYVLEAAVGTTYSLDLEALTAVSISLGLSEETDSELMQNPISMLNALQKVSDKILIFCEAGQIKLPTKQSPLFLLLEKMVITVTLPFDKNIRRYPSFHPKMWLLMYQNNAGDKIYRFVILSRNLTFDRSWDVAVALEGKEEKEKVDSSKPIVDFLDFLRMQIKPSITGADSKIYLLDKIRNNVAFVAFEMGRKEFSDFQIMPLGIGEHQYNIEEDALWKETFHEMLIVSPFVSGGVIEHFNDSKKGLTDCKRTLITRRTELKNLKDEKADNFHVYVIKDQIYDGEDEVSDEAEERQKQDIHAKIYLRRKNSKVDLYLGSMNASYAAMNKNVELILMLRTRNGYLNTSKFWKEIFDGKEDSKENPFELVNLKNIELPEEEASELDDMERMIKAVCRAGGTAEVIEMDNSYQIRVHFIPKDWKYEMKLSPLCSEQFSQIKEEIIFENLKVLEISEFYIISVTGVKNALERVIMIPTANLPKNRESAVVQDIVKDRNTFLEYVNFILDDNHLLSMIEQGDYQFNGDKKELSQRYPAIYENMLKTAVNDPRKLDEIDYLLTMITDKKIVPDEFREVYQAIRSAIMSKK